MDNKDYEELEEELEQQSDEENIDDEESEEYDDSEETFDYDESDEESFYDDSEEDSYNESQYDFNNQNVKNKLRDLRNQNKQNQNTANRLNQRKANTMSKGVEAPKSTPSPSNAIQNGQSTNLLNKGINSAKSAGKGLGQKAGQAIASAGKAAGTAIAQGVKSLVAALVANPYFWVIVGVIVLLILIPILWKAYEGDDGSGKDLSGGYFDETCDFNLTKVNLTLDDGKSVDTGISFEDYIIGVAYAEIGEYIYLEGYEEYAKVAMITAKTYTLATAGYNNTNKEITLKASTYAHAWCDIYEGCMWYNRGSGTYWYYSAKHKLDISGASLYKSALNETNLQKAKTTYSEIANYLYAPTSLKGPLTSSSQLTATQYRDHAQNFWKKLASEGKTFKEILSATGTDAYPQYVSSARPGKTSDYNTAVMIRDIYKNLTLYNLSSYCDYTAVEGSCNTSTPIKIAAGEKFIITSPFGMRNHPLGGGQRMHNGIDLGYASGTPIYSIADGTVVAAGYGASAGNYVNIGHDIDGDGTYDYTTYNYHMVEPTPLSVGDDVVGGQQVGKVGTTGGSTGPHLHFGISDKNGNYIDPEPIIEAIRNKTSVFDSASVCKSAGGAIGDYPYYNQCDGVWSSKVICDTADYSNGVCYANNTICTSGCGYTSFSMIASGLNGDGGIKPDNVVSILSKYSYNPGGGAITDAALIDKKALNHYNMQAEVLFPRGSSLSLKEKKSKIVAALKSGRPVELLVPGHFVALVGINGDKVKLNDPGKRSNVGEYTIDELNSLFGSQRSCSDCFVYAIAYSRTSGGNNEKA
ncbi:MAG: hypothetical protein E7157_01180 [Lactobacillales bacterium]|nr:hypothetical protein [Lactobacillales bacterium]